MARDQLDHWATVSGTYAAIEDFIRFLEGKGVYIDFERANPGTSVSVRDNIYEFLEVDVRKLDEQRRALLTDFSAATANK